MTRRMQFSILISHYSLCLLLLLLLPINHATSEPEECQTYIIHMDHSQKPASFLTHESWHQSIVNSLLSTADDREMLLYSYNHVMHGFSASLTPSQLSAIEKSPAHLATYPESFGKLFTTYSPKFLGLQRKSGLWPAASFGEGAEESTATDLLAGMDQAIADGVDILSLSLGLNQTAYFKDVIAIASLSAIEKGIFVVCAAGNDGSLFSTYNGAPWIATVGAATLDRSFTATMTLENGLALEGISYFPESIYINNASLYYGRDNVSKAMCNASALDQNEVAGKVVLCDNSTKIDVYYQMKEVERAGAYAGIFLVDISDLQPNDFNIPSLILDTASGTLVRKYVTEDSKAKVKGYDEKQMKSILRRSQWNCSQEPTDLNYPSFMAIFNNETVRKFSRVVTNVGDEEAVYHANLKLPTGMKITIEPSTLTFTRKYQKQNFVLSIETDKEAPGMVYGFLNWIDQHNHKVSSPIVVIKT
ncbi:hypothetical protein Q3G72_027008 [Acer saccharum]|nr:hypothetical protein Q3G72_027008 [Acer saccharum]